MFAWRTFRAAQKKFLYYPLPFLPLKNSRKTLAYCGILFCICVSTLTVSFPAGNYMFKVKNRNTRTRCEICSKLTIKTPERRHWRIDFEQVSQISWFYCWLTASKCWLDYHYEVMLKRPKLALPLTLSISCISESYIEIQIKLNFYFHTSLWCLKRFYEGIKPKTFSGTTKKCENKHLT